MGGRLRAMFSSDMGHWDVQDMGGILGEAYELVEKELIDEDDFQDFTFANPVSFYTRMNPNFFVGTRVEDEAKKVIAAEGSTS